MLTVNSQPNGEIHAAIAPDGRTALSGNSIEGSTSFNGATSLRLWDLTSGSIVRTFNAGDVSDIAITPDGRKALPSCIVDSSVILWDLLSGGLVRRFTTDETQLTMEAATNHPPAARITQFQRLDRRAMLTRLCTSLPAHCRHHASAVVAALAGNKSGLQGLA